MNALILRFLRLFAAFRAAELAVQEATTRAHLAEVRADRLQERLDELDRRLQEAQRSEVASREIVADFVAQRHYGFSIYGRAPQLPASDATPVPLSPIRIQGRRLAREANRQALRSLVEEAQ